MIRKILKKLGLIVGGIAALSIVLYLAAVAINWRDQAPSEEAIRFASLYRERPAIADENNAYTYLMGIEVAPNEDPTVMGAERVAWLAKANRTGHFDAKEDPQTERYNLKSKRSPAIQKLVGLCRTADVKCAEALDDHGLVEEWLASEEWLLRRYQVWLGHSGWLEPVPFDSAAPLPSYSVAMDGQRLLFAKATILAAKKDHVALRALLSSDIRFWRHVLESSDILISKMIATAALRQHFKLGNLLLRRVPEESMASAVPAEWRDPISNSERSMLRCFVGEWIFGSNLVQSSKNGLQNAFNVEFDADDGGDDRAVGKRVVSALLTPLFQPQDFNNKRAEFLSSLVATMDVPYGQYSVAIQQADKLTEIAIADAPGWSAAYNPVGRWLLAISAPDFAPYALRVADVEGIRRAALAAIALRASKVKGSEMPEHLLKSDQLNPYNNEPFAWDSARESILFVGLQSGDGGQHYLLY